MIFSKAVTSIPIYLTDEDKAYTVSVSYNKNRWFIDKKETIDLLRNEKHETYFNVRLTKAQRPVLLLSPSQFHDDKHEHQEEVVQSYKNTPDGCWIAPNEQQVNAYYVDFQAIDDIARQFRMRRRVFYGIDCYDYGILNFLKEVDLFQENMLVLCEWKKIIRCLLVSKGALNKVINTSMYGIVQGNSTPEAVLTQKLAYYYPHYLDSPLMIYTIGYVPLMIDSLPKLWQVQSLYSQEYFQSVYAAEGEDEAKYKESVMLPLLGAGMFYAKYII